MKQKTFGEAQNDSKRLDPSVIDMGLKGTYPTTEVRQIDGQTVEITYIDRVTAVSRIVEKVPKRVPESGD